MANWTNNNFGVDREHQLFWHGIISKVNTSQCQESAGKINHGKKILDQRRLSFGWGWSNNKPTSDQHATTKTAMDPASVLTWALIDLLLLLLSLAVCILFLGILDSAALPVVVGGVAPACPIYGTGRVDPALS